MTAKEGGQVELYRSAADGQFRFRLEAKNGETILVSEGYQGKLGAERGILSVMRNGRQESAFDLKPASSNHSTRQRTWIERPESFCTFSWMRCSPPLTSR